MLESLKAVYIPKRSRKRQTVRCRKAERNVYGILYGESLSSVLRFCMIMTSEISGIRSDIFIILLKGMADQ